MVIIPSKADEHFNRYLVRESTDLKDRNGRPISIWHLEVPDDCPYLSCWAAAFRQHYRLDSELEAQIRGTGQTKAQHLRDYVFPGETKPGPSIRSGDFTELLISDYLEVVFKAWVPREKYSIKVNPNESVKGSDVIGFRVVDAAKASSKDTLFVYEVKAQLTSKKYGSQLQQAIDDSIKDAGEKYMRHGKTLAAMKLRFSRAGKEDEVLRVERFQSPTDNPFNFSSGAVAVLSDKSFDPVGISTSDASGHNNKERLELLVVKGAQLMKLVHTIYNKAADEA